MTTYSYETGNLIVVTPALTNIDWTYTPDLLRCEIPGKVLMRAAEMRDFLVKHDYVSAEATPPLRCTMLTNKPLEVRFTVPKWYLRVYADGEVKIVGPVEDCNEEVWGDIGIIDSLITKLLTLVVGRNKDSPIP